MTVSSNLRHDPFGRLARWLPAAVLIAVAALQSHLVDTANLSRWKGSGFGMFSTVDSPAARVLRLHLLAGDQEIPVLPPPELEKLATDARVLPSDAHLRQLAEAMARRVWVPVRVMRAQDSYHARNGRSFAGGVRLPFYRPLAEHETVSGEALPLRGVRVSIWTASFDRRSRKLTLLPAHHFTAALPEARR